MLSRLGLGRAGDRLEIRCDLCDDHPVLPTHNPDLNCRKCVRCQRRVLPLPHPGDHLCAVCKRECPRCRAATTTEGKPCRACRSRCRTCGGELTDEDLEKLPTEVLRVQPPRRPGEWHRFDKLYFPNPADRSRCTDCRDATVGTDPVRAVLAALPAKIIQSCGGDMAPAVMNMLRAELSRRTPEQLIQRIERRWWGTWTHRPVHREPVDAYDEDAYGPDDVALWLVAPTPCPARCEDGWVPAAGADRDDEPCPTCRGGRLLPSRIRHREDDETPPAAAAARTVAEAVHGRPPQPECPGQGGACGRPVAAGYDRCPACSDWPWCGCGRRRVDPAGNSRCRSCRQGEPALPATPHPAPRPAGAEPAEQHPHRDADGGDTPADRRLREAVDWRPPQPECPGQDGACGRPTTAPDKLCPECRSAD